MSSDNADDRTAEEWQSLSHDVRHCLHALRTGIDLLSHVRADNDQFEEVHRLLVQEIHNASDLIDEILAQR